MWSPRSVLRLHALGPRGRRWAAQSRQLRQPGGVFGVLSTPGWANENPEERKASSCFLGGSPLVHVWVVHSTGIPDQPCFVFDFYGMWSTDSLMLVANTFRDQDSALATIPLEDAYEGQCLFSMAPVTSAPCFSGAVCCCLQNNWEKRVCAPEKTCRDPVPCARAWHFMLASKWEFYLLASWIPQYLDVAWGDN